MTEKKIGIKTIKTKQNIVKNNENIMNRLIQLVVLSFIFSSMVWASVVPASLVFEGKHLFTFVSSVGAFTPLERQKHAEELLGKVAGDSAYDLKKLTLKKDEYNTQIVLDDLVLLSVTPQDAASASQTVEELALSTLQDISSLLHRYRNARQINYLLYAVLKTFLVVGGAYVFFKLLRGIFARIEEKLKRVKSNKGLTFLKIHNHESFSYEKIWELVSGFFRVFYFVLAILFLYFMIPVVLSFFPWTAPYSKLLVQWVVGPFAVIGKSIIEYLPRLFFVIVILLVTRWLLWGIRKVFTSVEEGHISIEGFHPDWAIPTFKLLSILIWIFAFAIIFPYLPGSKSPAFQGISVIAGLLFTFSSGPAIGNMVAGLVIIYMRPFKVGDRVKVGETIGDIVEKTILVTRLRTVKNEEITIPNSSVLSGQIVNYSSVGQLVLNTRVTIGYDAPWRLVHELLIRAALRTDGVLKEPQPFVFQKSLDDFYVCYEINAYTDRPGEMARLYSDLHSHIQDSFNEAEVEIMSPHYRANRNGNGSTIPTVKIK